MRYLTLSIALAIISCSAVGAWAQYGLYGAPDVLRLPQTRSDALPPQIYGNYADPDADAPVVPSTRVAPAPIPGEDNAVAVQERQPKGEKASRRKPATEKVEAAERNRAVDRKPREAGPGDEPQCAPGEACGAEPCLGPCAVPRECPW